MAKLYFKYGAMGSSKTAQALITKFNYEERDMKVWLIKPALDDRDGKTMLRSRIGLNAECDVIKINDDIYDIFEKEHSDCDVIIADECQFFSTENVDDLRRLVDEKDIPVLKRTLKIAKTEIDSRLKLIKMDQKSVWKAIE